MIHNRKNTSTVVDTWRNFLSDKKNTSITRLNESMMDSEEASIDYAKDRNEYFEALIADLTECNWDEERIDTLVDVLERCNATDSELKVIGYGSSEPMSAEVKDSQQNRFIEREPLEADDDLGM